jgi:hypothetical protein
VIGRTADPTRKENAVRLVNRHLSEVLASLILWAVLAAVLAPAISVPLAAETLQLEDLELSRLRWSELGYRAKKLTFSATTDLKLATVPAANAETELVAPSRGEARSPGAEVLLMTMESKGVGQNSLTRIWMDPGNAAAFQRDQRDRGKKKRWRAYRYAGEGVGVLTRWPAAGEGDREPGSWSGRDEGFAAYPDWLGPGVLVAEPGAIFFIVAAAALDDAGDTIQVPVFSRNNLILVELTVDGAKRIKVDYTEVSGSRERRVKATVEALRLRVDSRHLDPDSDEGDFEFLGLRGDVEIFLDKATRVPLQVSGRVPVAGKVDVRVQRVALR